MHGQRQVALLPTKFYIVPGYLKFSTRADAPFLHFYIHFGLNERQPPQNQVFELDADAESLSLIRRFIRRETSPAVRQLTRLTALSVVASAHRTGYELLLLYSAMPMEDIAEATGFADRYHFSRVFWQVMHFTPAAFRCNQLVSHRMKRTE